MQYSQTESSEGNLFCDTLSYRDKRSLIFHLLYAVDAFDYDVSLESVAENFSRGFSVDVPKNSEVFAQTQAIINDISKLDEQINPLLANWRFERLGTATRLILRMSMWEFLNTDSEPLIVINESVELAKCFAEKDAYKFINGVLDEFLKRSGRKIESDQQASD